MEVVARVKGQLRRSVNYNSYIQSEKKWEERKEEYYNVRGLEIQEKNHKCLLYGKEIAATPIEFSILLYLCRHMNEVVSSEELFEAVWKEKYLDSNNTVMAHIARIRDKLGENARAPKFIKTVWGVGYKLEE